MSYTIRPCTSADAHRIAEIYNHYIANTAITFEEIIITLPDLLKRIEKVTQEYPWIVYEQDGIILGYAYLSSWKERRSYRYTAETTIYLAQEATGKGIGKILYGHLIELAKTFNIHVLMAVIALPNEGSVRLQEKFGFEQVAHFKEVGRKFDRWIDVGCWQLKV